MDLSSFQELVSQTAQIVAPQVKVFSPDENTELLDEDGRSLFVNTLDVQRDQTLQFNPGWETTKIGYLVLSPNTSPPNSTDSYWVELNGDGNKVRVSFSHYVSQPYGYQFYLKGNY